MGWEPRCAGGRGGWALILRGWVLLLAIGAALGCATKGDFRKLEERVLDASRSSERRPDPFERIAVLAAEVETLRTEQRRLSGQLDLARKTAEDALSEARKARTAATGSAGPVTTGSAGPATTGAAATGVPHELHVVDEPVPAPAEGTSSAEVVAYQEALGSWRSNDHKVCIDRFRRFLQTYPASPYADDAAYWMADCHFKQGDYRVAVLRFNDVVRAYPNGNKAPDALYRQGESLLKLGPGFYDAAKAVFKQVLTDYPDSGRAREARQQLEAIGNG